MARAVGVLLMTMRQALLTIAFSLLGACGGDGRAAPDAAEPAFMPTQVTVLANAELRPNGIVADEHAAYFISQGTPSTLRKLDLSSWAVTTVVADAGMAVRLVADADHVYFKSGEPQGGRLVEVDKATGTATVLATGSMENGMIAIDDDSVYWGTDDTGETILHAIKKDGSGMRDVGHVSGAFVYELLADGTRLYGTSASGIVAFDKATGAMTTVIATSGAPINANLAQDATSLYWSDRGDSTIKKIAKTGGAVTTLASNQPLPGRLAVADDGSVYWACRGSAAEGSTTLGALHELKAGASDVVEVAGGLDHAVEPFVLSHAVLWTVYGPTGTTASATGSVMAAPR